MQGTVIESDDLAVNRKCDNGQRYRDQHVAPTKALRLLPGSRLFS
jgi:hypothetical protein